MPRPEKQRVNCYFDLLRRRKKMIKPVKSIEQPAQSAPLERSKTIADVQSFADTRRLDIDKVGIKAIRHPIRIRDRSGGEQHTIATFNMYVYLPHNFKGTH